MKTLNAAELIALLQRLEPSIEIYIGDRDYGPRKIEPGDVTVTYTIELNRLAVVL